MCSVYILPRLFNSIHFPVKNLPYLKPVPILSSHLHAIHNPKWPLKVTFSYQTFYCNTSSDKGRYFCYTRALNSLNLMICVFYQIYFGMILKERQPLRKPWISKTSEIRQFFLHLWLHRLVDPVFLWSADILYFYHSRRWRKSLIQHSGILLRFKPFVFLPLRIRHWFNIRCVLHFFFCRTGSLHSYVPIRSIPLDFYTSRGIPAKYPPFQTSVFFVIISSQTSKQSV